MWTRWTTRGEPRCSLQQASALKNVDLHWHDSEGFTALHLAAGYVHTGIVKDLLEYGANLEKEDNQGRSPLSFASSKIS
jgi:ankyrin repeat protein